jgi:uncharacterized protein (DUF1800 family)
MCSPANAFGNFRTLLERITLNAGMGFFLNTRATSRKTPTAACRTRTMRAK